MHITAARISMYVTCGGCPTLTVMKKNLPQAMLCMRSSLFPGYTLQKGWVTFSASTKAPVETCFGLSAQPGVTEGSY